MGAKAYYYFVPYQPDFETALQLLRETEFNAGRYFPAVSMPDFPITPNSKSPGAQHSNISKAKKAAKESGTASILDLESISYDDVYGVARLLSDKEIIKYFAIEKPTRKIIENRNSLLENIDRGKGMCTIVYENNFPNELFFAGYFFD